MNTGSEKLALPFRFLQELDMEAYKEQQPTVQAGTAHSVRNCCDLTRACYYTANNLTSNWSHRMATEYLEYFAGRSLPDCLLLCGPDIINPIVTKWYRAPGMKVGKGEPIDLWSSSEDPEGEILAVAAEKDAGMLCMPKSGMGLAGSSHGCFTPIGADDPICASCSECEPDPNGGGPLNPDDPCCKKDTMFWAHRCCGSTQVDPETDFSYWIKSDDGKKDGTILNGNAGTELNHIGILERKIYYGYANFLTQSSGTEPPIALDDMFLKYFKKANGWNYDDNKNETFKPEDGDDDYTIIDRIRTTSLIIKGTADSNANVTSDTTWMVNRVKDLLFNGYGVMLLTNTGFNDLRDSTGISFPDRVFYHTYNIIGYDDTKIEYPECVYLLQLPMGKWNSGGHPSWGPLPDGSFLVTESHLKCLVRYFPTSDFYGCRARVCISTVIRDCNDPYIAEQYRGCGAGIEGRCDPYYCTPQQGACGFLIATSMSSGFPKQFLDHSKYYPLREWKKKLKNQKLIFRED